jgi:hypothetical protein
MAGQLVAGLLSGAVVFALAGPLAATDALDRETAVFEAAFRQQIEEHLDASERARGTVLCLAIDPGGAPQSPGPALMLRLSARGRVRRAAECDPRPGGAVEAQTLRRAIIVTVGPIDWLAEDEARVAVSIFQSAHVSARRTYRVVKEGRRWVSLGPIIIDGPA